MWVCTVHMLSGYHQIPLSEESRDLATSVTPFGKYRFCCQSIGMFNAGDEFNMETDLVIEEFKKDEEMMKFTLIDKSVDEVLICCKTKEQMEAATDRFFAICHRQGIKLSLNKFKISEKVIYCRVEIDTSGEQMSLRPEATKLEEICSFPSPTTKKQVQSFLGMCNAYNKWTSTVSKMSQRMRELTSEKIHFKWDDKHEAELGKSKEELTQAFNHKAFDKNLPIIMYTDASKEGGLGYVLTQEKDNQVNIISCGSTSLMDAQRNYWIVELELSAVVHALENAKHFTVGCNDIQIYTEMA